jgi:hypothetical protein
MDVRIQADAIAISGALIAAFLFVGERGASFSEAKFDGTVFGSVPQRRQTHGIYLLGLICSLPRSSCFLLAHLFHRGTDF